MTHEEDASVVLAIAGDAGVDDGRVWVRSL